MRDQTGTKRVIGVTGARNRVVAAPVRHATESAVPSDEAGQRDGALPVVTTSDDTA